MSYVDHPRFGNISTEDLIAREIEARVELEAMQQTIKARLIAESGILVGRVYQVADDGRSLAGRRILVEGVSAGMGWLGIGAGHMGQGFRAFAWGRMNGKSAARDGWSLRRQNIAVTRLTLEPEA